MLTLVRISAIALCVLLVAGPLRASENVTPGLQSPDEETFPACEAFAPRSLDTLRYAPDMAGVGCCDLCLTVRQGVTGRRSSSASLAVLGHPTDFRRPWIGCFYDPLEPCRAKLSLTARPVGEKVDITTGKSIKSLFVTPPAQRERRFASFLQGASRLSPYIGVGIPDKIAFSKSRLVNVGLSYEPVHWLSIAGVLSLRKFTDLRACRYLCSTLNEELQDPTNTAIRFGWGVMINLTPEFLR